MYDLFNPPPDSISGVAHEENNVNQNGVAKISGLTYKQEFLSRIQEAHLIEKINGQSWLSDIKRRVQHYGYKYDYKAKTIDFSMYLGPLPEWALPIAKQLYLDGYIDQEPDQLIINEYKPGQGIANHVDCKPCFTNTVISISLGSPCVMDFISVNNREKIEALLEPRSIVAITGDARYKWTHGIAQRKSDLFNGKRVDRGVRISMTFRKVILDK